jgi:glycosyltransferase involved in cell wall biosynthesis
MDRGKIFIVCGGAYVSGKEIMSLHLGHGLREAGWVPEFITSRWTNGDFPRRLERAGFRHHPLRVGFISATLGLKPMLYTLDQLRYWPVLLFRYARLVSASAPRAVVHTNWHHALMLLPLLRRDRDVYWLHEVLPNNRRYAWTFASIAKRVGRIVCVSQAVARSVVALGIPASHIIVIHNGLPSVAVAPAVPQHGPLRLGIVGQIGSWKGHDDVLEALALLGRAGTGVKLRIFGSGSQAYIDALKRKIAQLDLVENVEWCGVLTDQSEIYVSIDVCVVPSRFEEPLATSAIEAGWFGLPVICSSKGGLPEIVTDGVTGFVVEAERPDQLARAIGLLGNNRDLVKTMGEAARAHAQAEFSLEQFVENFERVVDEVTP